MFRMFIGSIVAILITGCASSGNKMDRARVDEIHKGSTTRAEVEQRLGAPDSVTMMGDGRRMMFYHYQESKAKATNFIPYANLFAGGADTRRQTLQIIMRKDDVVDDYEFSDKTGEIRHGFGTYSQSEQPTPASAK